MTDYGDATEKKIDEVLRACRRYGGSSIIALAGVPGTGKSFIGSVAAQRYASDPLMVREIQFHQSFTYEEFVEGMRIDASGEVRVEPGIFLEWNQRALDDPDHQYVLLIEELTRANLSAVLGELMTYVEHRERPFTAICSRRPVFVAPNLTIIATYNPTDRSAIEIDSALLRRLRVIDFPPSVEQLEEMLSDSRLSAVVVQQLKVLFDACAAEPDYEFLMPFGHGIFAEVRRERPDLYRLWQQRIRRMLYRPFIEPSPFAATIAEHYPWRSPAFTADVEDGAGADDGEEFEGEEERAGSEGEQDEPDDDEGDAEVDEQDEDGEESTDDEESDEREQEVAGEAGVRDRSPFRPIRGPRGPGRRSG